MRAATSLSPHSSTEKSIMSVVGGERIARPEGTLGTSPRAVESPSRDNDLLPPSESSVVNRDIGRSPMASTIEDDSVKLPTQTSTTTPPIPTKVEERSNHKNGGSLLRLFQSEVFDSHFHMYYLFKRSEQGIHDYLVNLLYKRPDEEIHFYLPQLCQLAIVKFNSSALPRFLLDKAAKSMHLALKANWIFQAAWEDKIGTLSDLANKMREEIEMAVVNSKPCARDSSTDPMTPEEAASCNTTMGNPGRTPDLFLRRRAVQHLVRSSRSRTPALAATENAVKFLGARFPEYRVNAAISAEGPSGLYVTAESSGGNRRQTSRSLSPNTGSGAVPRSPHQSPSTEGGGEAAALPPLPTVANDTVPRTPERTAAAAPPPPNRKSRKGRIAPGFVSHTGPVSIPSSKVKLASVYTKLHTPFSYTSFSRESHSSLLNDNEMQPFIIKQRRCEYFNTVGQFISMLVEVSEKTAGEPDRDLRLPLLKLHLKSLNEWMLCRRCIVAASEGIFAMTGLLIPFTHFGVEPEAATLGVPTPFQAPFLTHPTLNLVDTPSHFSSVQILRICIEQCRVFSSKKRAPYLLVFELADLDEDINRVSEEVSNLATDRRQRTDETAETQAENDSVASISWESLNVYAAILKELKQNKLFVPSYCDRPLNEYELERIEDPKTNTITCAYCKPPEGDFSKVSSASLDTNNIRDVFPFECPKCKGTAIFFEAAQKDQRLHALRRSMGVSEFSSGRSGPQGDETWPLPLHVPPFKPGAPNSKTGELGPGGDDDGSTLKTPTGNSDSERYLSPEQLSTGTAALLSTRPRRPSILASLGLSGPGGGSGNRSHSLGRRRTDEDNRIAVNLQTKILRRSSSVGGSPHRRKSSLSSSGPQTFPLVPPNGDEVRHKKSTQGSGSAVLPSLTNLFGSARTSAVGVGTNEAVPPSKPPLASSRIPSSVPQIRGQSETKSGDVTRLGENESAPVLPDRFPPLFKPGETANEQAVRIRKILWPEPWEDMKAKIRQNSPYGSLESWKLGAVIVKGNDDVRQELLASQLVRQFKAIFDEANLRLWLRPYEILVTGSHSGIMEFVPDTQSIDAVKRKFNVDSISKVFEVAFADNLCEAKKNFIESHAAYSLLGYILQVKDRHNGNLLLDNKGHIVHIDFGFMLSNSPGYVNFETSPFKLSAEIMSIMDGADSENFETFKELLLRGFLETRKHHERVILAVEMMLSASKMPCFGGAPETALLGLRDRFMIGLREDACIQKVLELIEQSVYNWRTAQYDNFQRLTNGIF